MAKRDPRTPVEMQDVAKLPKVILYIFGIVGAGVLTQIVFWITGIGGGLLIWPFLFAVCVLLAINDAAAQNAVGVPPFQAYGLFFGTLIGLFVLVFLISKTINPYLILLLVIGVAIYLIRDWQKRKVLQREFDRRRLAGVCVRCCEPVTNGPEDICMNCGRPVNPERMNLLRLGRAVQNMARAEVARQNIGGTGPDKHKIKLQSLQQQTRAYKYKKK